MTAKEPYQMIVNGFSIEDNEYFEFVARALIDTRLKTEEEIEDLGLYLKHVRSLFYPSLSNQYTIVYFVATKDRPDCTYTKELPHHETFDSDWYYIGPTEKTLLEYLYCALADLHIHSQEELKRKTKQRALRNADNTK